MDEIINLPVYKAFNRIINSLGDRPNLILKSPTGSGKSLGLPLLLLKEDIINGQILVVQPRRVAARSLATRATKLLNTKIGDQIGYHVRFENISSNHSKIIYITDGILLNLLINDRYLSRVGLVIMDEFHERTAQMDLSLSLLKDLQKNERPSIHLIIASATIDEEKVHNFLPNCSFIELTSRLYPVKIEYRPILKNEPLWSKINTELKRSLSFSSGNILIFVAGIYEIKKIILEINRSPHFKAFLVMPLFGDMRLEDQEKVLKKTDKRKIIVSTNIAETSLTIEDIQVVIDTGIAKKFAYDPLRDVNVLLPELISISSADQRSGRAGRTSKGICIRLWNENQNELRSDYEVPQVLNLELSRLFLILCFLKKDPEKFDWLITPNKERIQKAKHCLVSIGAINNENKITEEGCLISQIPLCPKKAMALIKAKESGCLPILALVFALMEERSIIINKLFNFDKIDQFLEEHNFLQKEDSIQSDLKYYLGAWLFAKHFNFSYEVCNNVGIHSKRSAEVEKLLFRLCQLVGELNPEINKLNISTLLNFLVTTFSENLSHIRNRGTVIYESIRGNQYHLSRFSNVKNAEWILPLFVTEKKIKGKITLETECISEVSIDIIKNAFKNDIKTLSEVKFDSSIHKVVKRHYNKLGSIKYNIKESEVLTESESREGFVNALLDENLMLKKWNKDVVNFIARIDFLANNFPEYNISKFDYDYKVNVYHEICEGTTKWKVIKNRDVLPIIKSLYSQSELETLETAVPETILLNPKRKPYKINYEENNAFVKVLIQDLFDYEGHPQIVYCKYSLVVHLLAPNNNCVQITRKLNEFWSNSYSEIKKELAGRYPKHEWR